MIAPSQNATPTNVPIARILNKSTKAAARRKVILATTLAQLVALAAGFAQTNFHNIAGIMTLSNSAVSLQLVGATPSLFKKCFDIYLLEASTNLLVWGPLPPLLRTNSATNVFTYLESEPVGRDIRFYHTQANVFPTALPNPTGPYAVGVQSLLLNDPARRNRDVPTNSPFMISMWYPALSIADAVPTPYVEPKLAANLQIHLGFYAHVSSIPSVATNEAPYPVVIYSHRFGEDRRYNSAKFEELASYGYLVASIRVTRGPSAKIFGRKQSVRRFMG